MTDNHDEYKRIIKTEYMDLDVLIERYHPRNPKDHDYGAIINGLLEFGFVTPGVLDSRTGYFACGNGRTKALDIMRNQQMNTPEGIHIRDGKWLVPVNVGVSFVDDRQLDAYLIADNRLTILGGWDNEALTSLLQDLAVNDEKLMQATGYDGDDLDNLLYDLAHTTDAGYTVDKKMLDKWKPVNPENEDGLQNSKDAIQLPSHLLFERKPENRRILASEQRNELSELMPQLPSPDTDYYIITTGRGKRVESGDVVRSFGFGNFIDYVTEKIGDGCVVYISTWSMNIDHAFMLLELLETGRIGKLHILCDPNFTERKTDIFLMLKTGMDRFEGSRWFGFKNHSKILCIGNQDRSRFCSVTGSSNLSGLPRSENYTISTSPEMYHHFVNNFFEVMFSKQFISKDSYTDYTV